MYIYFFVLILSFTFTGLLRRYALAAQLLDIPNHRSSHVVPTPRGGGLAFVLCFLLLVLNLAYHHFISMPLLYALAGTGAFIAFLGFLDDRSHIHAKWRLLGHFIACGVGLYFLGGMPAVTFFSWTFSAGIITNLLGLFYLVWLLNLYNFMDGIDGLAAVEAVFVCLGSGLLYYLNSQIAEMYLPMGLAIAVLGFLFWNFPPARIFMGDAGSSFLGLILGLLSIQSAHINPSFIWIWLILLGVFIVDATVTLFCRAIAKESLHEAHRSHAYQHASKYYDNHRTVTLGILLINILWLLPVALLVNYKILTGCTGLLIAYIPLIFIAFKFNAGKKS